MNSLQTKSLTVTAVASALVACGGATAPQAQLVDARSTISAADAEGAKQVPKASLYLKMARDGVDQAEALMKEKEYQAAKTVLERALIDAKLSRSLTEQAHVKAEAEKQMDRLRSLQEANAQLLKRARALG